MKEVFYEKEYEDESVVRNKSTKTFQTKNEELSLIVNEIENLTPNLLNFKNNFTKKEYSALQSLKENQDIVFKTADKGGGWVIMDKNYYREKIVKDHLLSNVYKEVSLDSDKKVFKKLKEHIKKYESILTKKEIDYLINFKFSSSQFYCLPKVHKSEIIKNVMNTDSAEYIQVQSPDDLKGRPISGGPESPTQRLSSLIEILLKPLVPTLKTYIKDDWDFLRKLPTKIPFDCTMYSCDISSLYTSIPTELGLEAITYWLQKRHELIPQRFTNSFIIKSLEFILKNNNVLFDDHMYLQMLGTAMGTKCAPPYACLTIGYLEETKLFREELPKYFNQVECNLITELLNRYMDDGFIFWPLKLNFENFKICLNNMHPSINFTFEEPEIYYINQNKVQTLSFLDIKIILHEDNSVETDIYYKPTNTHDYLPYDSAHPEHIKNNIPYNLAKRIIVFVSNPDNMITRLEELREFLKDCKYPEHVISQSFFNAKLQGPAPNPEKNKDIIPFVTTYYPNIRNRSLMKTVQSKFQNIRNEQLKNIYKDTSFILSQKQPKNLYRELASPTFISSSTKIRKPGTYKCNDKRCKVCCIYLNETNNFLMSNGQIWEIRRIIDCHSINVIYYLKCKMCNENETYIGKTIGDNTKGFKVRINQHIFECKTGISTCKFPRHVYSCGIKNNCLQEPFFSLNIMLRLNESDRLESIEKYFHLKGYDTMNNPRGD